MIASLTDKINAYNARLNEYKDYRPFKNYFETRLNQPEIQPNVQYNKVNRYTASKLAPAVGIEPTTN